MTTKATKVGKRNEYENTQTVKIRWIQHERLGTKMVKQQVTIKNTRIQNKRAANKVTQRH